MLKGCTNIHRRPCWDPTYICTAFRLHIYLFTGFKICLGYRESNQRFVHLILGLLAAAPTAGCRISMQEQEFNQQLFSALSHKQIFFSLSAALSTLLPLKADYILVLLLVRNLFPLVTI